jgi:hypothetical protein
MCADSGLLSNPCLDLIAHLYASGDYCDANSNGLRLVLRSEDDGQPQLIVSVCGDRCGAPQALGYLPGPELQRFLEYALLRVIHGAAKSEDAAQ